MLPVTAMEMAHYNEAAYLENSSSNLFSQLAVII
jgi:hypothetical protein